MCVRFFWIEFYFKTSTSSALIKCQLRSVTLTRYRWSKVFQSTMQTMNLKPTLSTDILQGLRCLHCSSWIHSRRTGLSAWHWWFLIICPSDVSVLFLDRSYYCTDQWYSFVGALVLLKVWYIKLTILILQHQKVFPCALVGITFFSLAVLSVSFSTWMLVNTLMIMAD